ncbi:hypothetical protein HQQ94_03545 [Shewanella sp. VB17]|uniref:hypothetical protein n=1 Tax=Shewanella sp. VB17 TaxID=2739432 RepID=UPI0015670633|nr:hypothetical protein [Shewanella sp. VB17]NRD72330.1 hypothetical protein [Shewanella sp. VB17]
MFTALKKIIIIFIISHLILVTHIAEAQKITFAFNAEPTASLYVKWGELVYTDAFARLNIDFSYIVLPAIRASQMADLGQVDGEAGRVGDYGARHPNLIRINEPLANGSLSAYTYDASININSWKDLENSQYKVEYYRGAHLAHQRLSKYVSADRLSNSSTPSESLRKLMRPKMRGRIDIYVGIEQFTNEVLSTPEFTDIKMQVRLEEIIFYGYLHKRHKELAVRLAEVLRQMKSEGRFNEHYKQAQQFIYTTTK